jgi:hypothetical protein
MADDDPAGGAPPAEDPTAAELAALRKEKADREAADAAEREAELVNLRKYKADQEAARARRPAAPTPRAEKDKADAVPPEPVKATAGKPRGKSGASRRWFGAETE